MVEIDTGVVLEKHFSDKVTGMTLGQGVNSFLLKTGFSLFSLEGLNRDISAVTNNVFSAELVDAHGEIIESIIKISQQRCEPRELALSGGLGGWNPDKLENESKILALVQNSGISSPSPIFYEKLDERVEVFAETSVEGQKCVDLRTPNVSAQEFARLEAEKGKILSQINRVQLPVEGFGTLENEAKRFDTWSEYFLTKVATTLSCLYGMYDKVNKLEHFSDLVKSDEDWKLFLENIAKLYSNGVVLHLIEKDGKPTLSHGDFWDGNLIANNKNGEWDVSVIDFERGGIEGKSFDLSLWLTWKVGGNPANPDPLKASEDFLKGYKEAGGTISPDIGKYLAIYSLWQYLDFLIMDTIYGIDRTDESVYEIKKLNGILQGI